MFWKSNHIEQKSESELHTDLYLLISNIISIEYKVKKVRSTFFPQQKDNMEVASCAFPLKSIVDLRGNNALPSNSVFKCGTLDQSKGRNKSRDVPIFKPLNMKTEPKRNNF